MNENELTEQNEDMLPGYPLDYSKARPNRFAQNIAEGSPGGRRPGTGNGVSMETITITVANDRLSKLKEIASEFNVTLEELVRSSIENLPEAVFRQAMECTLDKTRELYQRLA
jgi:hypothetical protein